MFKNGIILIFQGNALDVLKTIESDSIDCVITSPPYWALRAYGTVPVVWNGSGGCEHEWGSEIHSFKHKPRETNPGKEAWYKNAGGLLERDVDAGSAFCQNCGAWKGELGLEPDFNLYLDHLLQIFREVKRVLKPTGTCFVNIGDTYSGSGCGTNDYRTESACSIDGVGRRRNLAYKPGGIAQKIKNVPAKCLCGIPERFALRMSDELGFTRRNTLIWWKRNCMPSSVSDRFTVDFEPVFFFVKSNKYFFDQQFEKVTDSTVNRFRYKIDGGSQKLSYGDKKVQRINPSIELPGRKEKIIEEGRNMRCVWDIPTASFSDAHFAVFPEKLVIPMIEAGCPKMGIVLDPFSGAGTTCIVAKKLGRRYFGIELNPDYVCMTEKRIELEAGTLL